MLFHKPLPRPLMRTPLPPFQYIRKRGLQLELSTGYSRVSIQSWDRCSSDGASGNLVHSNCDLAGDSSCCSTNRYMAYLEGVPLNPSFEGLPSKILCANVRLHTGTPLYKFYFATRDGDMLHKATPLIVSHHHGTYMLQDAGGRSISRLLVSNLYTSK